MKGRVAGMSNTYPVSGTRTVGAKRGYLIWVGPRPWEVGPDPSRSATMKQLQQLHLVSTANQRQRRRVMAAMLEKVSLLFVETAAYKVMSQKNWQPKASE